MGKGVTIAVLVLTTLVKSMQIGLKGAIEVTLLLSATLRLEPLSRLTDVQISGKTGATLLTITTFFILFIS